ncbi:unnamed protein product [Nezara viridula]|uniref:Neuropeptide n=1 Tax=Nezara viridula TaxID=85310 RepID=A0A9P0MLL3_NEZVI|nr:unnamed protein product [Nezara viridula]
MASIFASILNIIIYVLFLVIGAQSARCKTTPLPPNCYQPVCGPCPDGAQCFCDPGTPLGDPICSDNLPQSAR